MHRQTHQPDGTVLFKKLKYRYENPTITKLATEWDDLACHV